MAAEFGDKDERISQRRGWECGGAPRSLLVDDLPALKVSAFAALQRSCINFHKHRFHGKILSPKPQDQDFELGF